MAHSDNRSDVLFLLGAGASKDAGLPLATEITDFITSDIETGFPPLLPLLRFVHGGICFGRGCAGEVPDSKVNIEEFLMACQDLSGRSKSSLYPFVASWHEKLTEFSTLTLGELRRLPIDPIYDDLANRVDNAFQFVGAYSETRLRDYLKPSNWTDAKYFRNLKDFVENGFRLHIFTLNYDECVERALEHELGEINTKWTTGFDHNGWKPILLENNRKKFDAVLYKLHGSLDWIEDEELGVCSTKWPAAERVEEIPESSSSLLIFATATKVVPRDPYLTLLVRFKQQLFRCKCIVILGYSFGDAHVNTMLLDAMRTRPELQCVIANRNPDASSYLTADLKEQIANERFHNVYDEIEGEKVGVRLALEKDMLLEKVKEVCDQPVEDAPF